MEPGSHADAGMDLDTALEEQRREKENQNDIRCQPVGALALREALQGEMMEGAKNQAADDQGHRVGNSYTTCHYSND